LHLTSKFLVPGDSPLPAGLGRADAAAIRLGRAADRRHPRGGAAPALAASQRGAGIDRIATPRLVGSGRQSSPTAAATCAKHRRARACTDARLRAPAACADPQASRAARWEPPSPSRLFELSGQTLAIVGAGSDRQRARAARRSARDDSDRRAPFGLGRNACRHRAHRPRSIASTRALGGADHVAIALPLTAETRGLFSTALIAKIKPGAYLYNVGRGAIVDPAALLDALRSGQLAGAGLDVTEPEPLPADSPLWREPGVVITAHSSGNTPRSYERYERLLLDNLGRWVARRAAAQRGRQAARLLTTTPRYS
jgi:hypothetical protein